MSPFYYFSKITGNKKSQLKHLLLTDNLALAEQIQKSVVLSYEIIEDITSTIIKKNKVNTLKYILDHNITNSNMAIYYSKKFNNIKAAKTILHRLEHEDIDDFLQFLSQENWDKPPTSINLWAKGINTLYDELRSIANKEEEDWYRLYEYCRLDKIQEIKQYHFNGGNINAKSYEALWKSMKNEWTIAADYLCEFCDEDGVFDMFPQYLALRDIKRRRKSLHENLNKNLSDKKDIKKIKI